MLRRIVECVPNFSEGRDESKVNAIAAAITRGLGIALLGKTMDHDHHRSVITFAGSPDDVAEAALRAVTKAAELIDLNSHSGVHPRIGATDVLPFVPVEGVTLQFCAELATKVAEEIWRRLGIPVYLYEAAARIPERKRLEVIRRGGFEHLRHAAEREAGRAPDIGGPGLHPTAGATVVGARPFLIAYNVNLATRDIGVAQRIAGSIRTSSGGFPHVKALGLPLESRGQTQVSMNLTDFRVTPVHVVFDEIRKRAEAEGVAIAASEIIGLIPKAALEKAAAHFLQVENFSSEAVLENKLAEALPYTVDDVLDQLADPTHAAGGGSAAGLAAAMAASLGMLSASLMKVDQERMREHRRFFRDAADRDAQAFAALMRSAAPGDEALREATLAPLSIAERAADLHSELEDLARSCPPQYRSDVLTALGLAEAAKRGALATVELNLPRLSAPSERQSLAERVRTIK